MRRYTETPFSILHLLLDIVVSLLSLRFVFALLGANPANAVVHFLYDVTQPMVEPFRDVFQNTVLRGATLEWSTLAAMLAYTLMAIVLMRFLGLLTQIVDDDDAMVYHRHSHHHRRHRHA
jgi:YggT family protein